MLLGGDEEEVARQFTSFFSDADYRAHRALSRELAAFREDIAPTWLTEPL